MLCPAVPAAAAVQVVDFQWNPADPWTFFSVADEAGEGGGGTLQLWRLSDLVYRPEDEVLGELEPYR
jgi:histone-binding protein RBBP4